MSAIVRSIFAAVTVATMTTPVAGQSLTFAFGQSGQEVTSVAVAAGGSADVQVYLKSTADMRFDTRDLFSVGVRVNTPGGLLAAASLAPNTGAGRPFNSSNSGAVGVSAAAAGLQVLADGAALAPFAATDRVLLGTFTYTAGATEGSFALSAVDLDTQTDDSIAASNLSLDNLIVLDRVAGDPSTIAPASIMFTVVPEPAGLLVAITAGGATLLARRRVSRTMSRTS